MNLIIDNYTLFFNFIDQFLSKGFKDINEKDPLIRELEEMTTANKQFFFVFDVIQLKILYSSKGIYAITGIEPKDVNPSFFLKLLHPDDLSWHSIVQTKLYNLGHQLFHENKGSALLSTNLRFKSTQDQYAKVMLQTYMFHTTVPYKTVFILNVLTDISWHNEIKPGYHFYVGNDPAFFRYPNEKMLMTGDVFSALYPRLFDRPGF